MCRRYSVAPKQGEALSYCCGRERAGWELGYDIFDSDVQNHVAWSCSAEVGLVMCLGGAVGAELFLQYEYQLASYCLV